MYDAGNQRYFKDTTQEDVNMQPSISKDFEYGADVKWNGCREEGSCQKDLFKIGDPSLSFSNTYRRKVENVAT